MSRDRNEEKRTSKFSSRKFLAFLVTALIENRSPRNPKPEGKGKRERESETERKKERWKKTSPLSNGYLDLGRKEEGRNERKRKIRRCFKNLSFTRAPFCFTHSLWQSICSIFQN